MTETRMGVKTQVACITFDRVVDGTPGYCQCVGDRLPIHIDEHGGPFILKDCGLPLKIKKDSMEWRK